MDISTTKSNLKYGLEELKKSEYLLDEDEIVINDLLTDLQSANDEAKINLIQEEYNKLKLKIDTLKELYKHSLYFIKPGFLARINLFFKELMKLVNNSSSKLTIKSMLDNLEDKKFILS